jgi:hypothetical protein
LVGIIQNVAPRENSSIIREKVTELVFFLVFSWLKFESEAENRHTLGRKE